MKYIINSTKKYSKHSLNLLIPSLLNSEISPKDILVIMGGCDEEYEKFHVLESYCLLKTKINAFDLTSFYIISFFPHLFDEKSYFYLHDTTFVDKNFKTIVEEKSEEFSCRASPYFCCNRGINLKTDIIKVMWKPRLKEFENLFSNENNLEEKKEKGIKLEDIIFKIMNVSCSMSERIYVGKEDVYKTGNPRTITHFPQISLYKYSANADLGKEHPWSTMIGAAI